MGDTSMPEEQKPLQLPHAQNVTLCGESEPLRRVIRCSHRLQGRRPAAAAIAGGPERPPSGTPSAIVCRHEAADQRTSADPELVQTAGRRSSHRGARRRAAQRRSAKRRLVRRAMAAGSLSGVFIAGILVGLATHGWGKLASALIRNANSIELGINLLLFAAAFAVIAVTIVLCMAAWKLMRGAHSQKEREAVYQRIAETFGKLLRILRRNEISGEKSGILEDDEDDIS